MVYYGQRFQESDEKESVLGTMNAGGSTGSSGSGGANSQVVDSFNILLSKIALVIAWGLSMISFIPKLMIFLTGPREVDGLLVATILFLLTTSLVTTQPSTRQGGK